MVQLLETPFPLPCIKAWSGVLPLVSQSSLGGRINWEPSGTPGARALDLSGESALPSGPGNLFLYPSDLCQISKQVDSIGVNRSVVASRQLGRNHAHGRTC